MPQVLRNKNILVICGDVSGDVHASNLVKEIKKIEPQIIVNSIGGIRLKEVSDKFIYDIVSHGSFGFTSTIKSIGLWVKMINIVRRFIEEKKPSFIILVDFFGFNRQVLGLANHRQIPAYYYIPPQVWASRAKRAVTISKLSKKIFAIFPFEIDIYKKHKGNVSFFGHPLSDIVPDIDISEKLNKNPGLDYEYKIGILPGSRKSEIESHLKSFISVFNGIKSHFKNSKGYVFAVNEFDDEFYYDIIGENSVEVIRDNNYEFRKKMDFCLTCSGTATLENAFLAIPMLVGYKTSFINYEIAKAIIKLPYISLVNIVLKKEVVKEFVQYSFKVDKMIDYSLEVLKNRNLYDQIMKEMYSIKAMLSSSDKSVCFSIAQKIISDFEII